MISLQKDKSSLYLHPIIQLNHSLSSKMSSNDDNLLLSFISYMLYKNNIWQDTEKYLDHCLDLLFYPTKLFFNLIKQRLITSIVTLIFLPNWKSFLLRALVDKHQCFICLCCFWSKCIHKRKTLKRTCFKYCSV